MVTPLFQVSPVEEQELLWAVHSQSYLAAMGGGGHRLGHLLVTTALVRELAQIVLRAEQGRSH